MVLVEEVPEDVLLQEGEKDSDFETDSNASDASSIFSDDEDDFSPADETLYERLVALKDIVPPQTRSKAHARYVAAKSWTWWGLQGAGSIGWVVSTTALLIVLPLALATEDEHKIVQQEREMQAQTYGQQQVSRTSDSRIEWKC
jgi:import receptor subunit TOM22